MNPITSLQATPKASLLNSVLAPQVEAFATRIERGRVATRTGSRYLGSIAHRCGVEITVVRSSLSDFQRTPRD